MALVTFLVMHATPGSPLDPIAEGANPLPPEAQKKLAEYYGLAVFLIILFSFVIPLFPTGGWDSPRDWVLPTITLAMAPMGIIARFTRASMLEVIRADFTLTARAKGLSEGPVIFKHALKNA